MRHKIILMTALAVLLLAVPVAAQQSSNYDLSWNTLSGGGGASQSANYTLDSSLGQFGVGETSGANYTLIGGFWAGVQQAVSIQAVTAMNISVDTDGVVVVNKVIEETQDPATGLPVVVQGGIGSYTDQLTYDGLLVNVLGIRPGDAPFDAITNVTIDDIGGTTTFDHTQVADTPQAPILVARAAVRLVGCTNDLTTLTDSFTAMASTEGAPIQELSVSAEDLRRGDAKVDGVINIADALFIAQYLAGVEPGLSDTHLLNAASVKEDGGTGDKISISDVLFIAQGLVGLRDKCFDTLELSTPPER